MKIYKEKKAECQKRWRQANKEHIALKNKQYQKDNPEYMNQWHEEHKKHEKQYRQENKEEIDERNNQWRIDNPEYDKQYRQTLSGIASAKAGKARRRILTKDLTTATVQRVYEDNIKQFGTLTCVLCGKPVEFKDSSLEHLTPLSKGGNNDYNNLGVAHLNCNTRKHAMTMDEWFKKQENMRRDESGISK